MASCSSFGVAAPGSRTVGRALATEKGGPATGTPVPSVPVTQGLL